MAKRELPKDQYYLRDTFGDNGHFARAFPGYERREGQLRLTVAIHNAFHGGYNLLAEAPCGTGKSMAYLIPAIEHATPDHAVIVVTANIALQEQLIYKDLPELQRVLGRDIKFGLIKGKQNYLCQSRFDEWLAQQTGLYGANDEEAAEIIEWGKETETGDVTELGVRLDKEPDRNTWSRICGDSDECKGCKDAGCFSYKAREEAAGSQVIVCNYHVLFAHLNLVRATHGRAGLLPPLKLLVCDESHEMADIAREFARISVSEGGIQALCTEALRKQNAEVYEALKNTAKGFFHDVRVFAEGDDYRYLIKQPNYADASDLIQALIEHNMVWEQVLEGIPGKDAKQRAFKKTLKRRIRRGQKATTQLQLVTSLEDENFVYWIEGHDDGRRGRRGKKKEPLRIQGKPKSVAKHLQEVLFSKTSSVVLTSATLTTNDTFKFIRRELGIKGKVLAVDSPFDLDEQSMLVVPRLDSAPNDDTFIEDVVEELEPLLHETNGRALGLFTSYRNMQKAYEGLLIADLPFKILMQGDQPKTQLLKEFFEDTHSVLLGTKSFWQGVDIRGEALTLLFIDKIPFPPPSDPVIAAMDEDPNENAFWDHSIPRATIALRQGFGRLIRSRTDAGVCVIFDRRLLTKGYGDKMLASLGDFKVHTRTTKIYRFLDKHGLVSEEDDEPEPANELSYLDEEVPF
jgi:ATP-dependent DNA helicase DinG